MSQPQMEKVGILNMWCFFTIASMDKWERIPTFLWKIWRFKWNFLSKKLNQLYLLHKNTLPSLEYSFGFRIFLSETFSNFKISEIFNEIFHSHTKYIVIETCWKQIWGIMLALQTHLKRFLSIPLVGFAYSSLLLISRHFGN